MFSPIVILQVSHLVFKIMFNQIRARKRGNTHIHTHYIIQKMCCYNPLFPDKTSCLAQCFFMHVFFLKLESHQR